MNRRNLSAIIGALLLAGCASVPETRLLVNPNGTLTLNLPKDFEAEDFTAKGKIGTNVIDITAKRISTKNNPAVIGASTEQVQAQWQGINQLFENAIRAAAKGASPIP